jgi:hypothetical protein
MSSAVALFISHGWDRPDYYDELVGILNSVSTLTFSDVSITQEKAISIQTGEDAIPQRRQLLSERLKAINSQSCAIDAEYERLQRDLAEVRHCSLEMQQYKHLDMIFDKAREKIAEPSFVPTIVTLEKLKLRLTSKYNGIDVDSALDDADGKIQELNISIARLEAERVRLNREAKDCRESLDRIDLNVLRLGKEADDRGFLLSRFPNLSLATPQSDCVGRCCFGYRLSRFCVSRMA